MTVGTNTSKSVSFTVEPDSVLEFPEYCVSGGSEFTVSQEEDLANQ